MLGDCDVHNFVKFCALLNYERFIPSSVYKHLCFQGDPNQDFNVLSHDMVWRGVCDRAIRGIGRAIVFMIRRGGFLALSRKIKSF